MPGPDEKIQEDILLARRMFLGGCLGLPWLWICNALYFRRRVFDPLVVVDYWPGQAPPSFGEEDGGDGADDAGVDPQRVMDRQLEYEATRKDLEKWVRRSTVGAFVLTGLFVAWIVTFQVNKEHFGPKWFVMDETEAAKTGW